MQIAIGCLVKIETSLFRRIKSVKQRIRPPRPVIPDTSDLKTCLRILVVK